MIAATARPEPFDVCGDLVGGHLALEASAGTGKTFTIAALVVRYVAEGRASLDQILVVTFARAATAELRDRIRTRLSRTRAHLAAVAAGAPAAHDDPVTALLAAHDVPARLERVERALADFDAATITTIHGFCQRVLATSGFAGDIDGGGTLAEDADDLVAAAGRDLLVRQWSDASDQGARPSPDTVAAVAPVVLRDPGAALRPAPDDLDAPPAGRALARLATALRETVDERKRARALLTFDDLLVRLLASLEDPAAGPTVCGALRSRYRVAFVDEFQDTDPTQWAILRTIFADRDLVLIGDPKQAIYRFRGADVRAYVDAVAAPGTRQATLLRSYRSDPRLVEALNELLRDATFGDHRIAHHDVEAVKEERLRFADGEREALQVRALLDGLGADDARRLIARDLAAEVTRLLDSSPTIATPEGPRPIEPRDCAVLVRTNAQGEDVCAALRAVGVHAVVNGVGSVLESAAAQDWQRLLEALERPTSAARARLLALTPIVGWTPRALAEMDAATEAALHDQIHDWARILARSGVATLVRTIQRATRMAGRLLAEDGGERRLTDFEHLAELLHAAATAERLGPSALLAWLADQVRLREELPSDLRARRLESDAHAVQILTIHRAKGLQFPVVFCPYLMSTGRPPQVPLRVRDGDDVVIDLGSSQLAEAKRQAGEEDSGELLRLLYVALTRAEHRLVVWWWPFWPARKAYLDSPLTKALFGHDGSPRVSASRRARDVPLGAAAGPGLDEAVARIPNAAWVAVPERPEPVAWAPQGAEPPALRARRLGRALDVWQRASYSSLTRPVETPIVGSEPAVRARDDEHDVAAAGADPGTAPHRPLVLAGQPAGAAFGTLVHAVLERVDLAAADLGSALRVETDRQARRSVLELADPAGLASGLALALRTPLGRAFGDATLAGVARSDRLDELEFELPLARAGSAVSSASLAAVLRAHLGPDDPFAPYADTLGERLIAHDVRGYLTGSIDLVLRRQGEDGPVFHVIDHKTNRLFRAEEAATTWHYRRDALVAAMGHGHYVLQALLYQVALHRYLRWRLPGYAPDRHLGAVGYTFLRGMVGPDAPEAGGLRCGVMTWQVPVALVDATSQLLEEGP